MNPLRNYTSQALAAMMGFGLVIGLVFPVVVDPFVAWIPGRKLTFTLLCLGAGLLVGGVSYQIMRSLILRRVASVAEQLQDTCIKQGDLTHRIPVETTDVIGELGTRFNENVSRLQELVRGIHKGGERMSTALGDLDGKVNSTGALLVSTRTKLQLVEQFFRTFDSTMAAIVARMEKLSSSSQETGSAVQEQESNIREIDNQANQMASVILEIVSAIDQLRASNRQVNDNAGLMASSAQSTLGLARDMTSQTEKVGGMVREMSDFSKAVTREAEGGKNKVDSLAGFMVDTDRRSQETFRVFESLKADSKSIGEIIGVMEEIGDQTGLLALNAAIIAAQAKEEGRSFAVVASEIRSLSDKTTQSARQVGKILEGIQKGILAAHSELESTQRGFSSGVDLSREARAILDHIAEMTRQSQERIGTIGDVSTRQAQKAGEISKAMDEVTQRATEVARAMEEQERGVGLIGAGAHSISDLAGSLKRSLGEQQIAAGLVSRSTTSVSLLTREMGKVNADHNKRIAEAGKTILEIHSDMDQSRGLVTEVLKDRELALAAMSELRSEILRFKV